MPRGRGDPAKARETGLKLASPDWLRVHRERRESWAVGTSRPWPQRDFASKGSVLARCLFLTFLFENICF